MMAERFPRTATMRAVVLTATAAAALGAASCGQLLGIEPWDPDRGSSAASTAGGAPDGPSTGSSSAGAGDGGSGAGTGGAPTSNATTSEVSSGGGGPDQGGASSGDPTSTASSAAAGPCGGLDECMGVCLDCFGGECSPGEARCEPGLLGTASATGPDAFVAIGPTRVWYGRGSTFHELPLSAQGGNAPIATQVGGPVSGLTVLGNDAIGAYASGIVRIAPGGTTVALYAAPAATVSGVAVGGGSVWFGGRWSGSGGIYQIDDTSTSSGPLSPICSISGPAPRAVAYVNHDLYLGAANQSSIGGGLYWCDSDAPGALLGDAIDKSVLRITRTSFGDFAAGAIHDVVPELVTFDDVGAPNGVILDGARTYDVAAWEDHLFFTLDVALGDLGTDGVYAIALPGGNVGDVFRIATCPGKCEAIAAEGDRLVYSADDGSVWSLQLVGVPQLSR